MKLKSFGERLMGVGARETSELGRDVSSCRPLPWILEN